MHYYDRIGIIPFHDLHMKHILHVCTGSCHPPLISLKILTTLHYISVVWVLCFTDLLSEVDSDVVPGTNRYYRSAELPVPDEESNTEPDTQSLWSARSEDSSGTYNIVIQPLSYPLVVTFALVLVVSLLLCWCCGAAINCCCWLIVQRLTDHSDLLCSCSCPTVPA